MTNKVPVLLIAFNRLDTVKQVFEAIRKYKPNRLYISADGPRNSFEGEKEKCTEVRNWIVSNVDWDCDVKTRFLEQNVGCGLGPSTAITWFFETEEKGIILEDDCVPNSDFFEYASYVLEKYKEKPEVMAVNSSNFQSSVIGDGAYYFSMQNGPFCAWATWRRAWLMFDYTMQLYSRKLIENVLRKYYNVTKRERLWWLGVYDNLVKNYYKGSSWDFQFIFAIWANKGKSIVPNANLSTNIGFGKDATHTTNPNAVTANRPLQFLASIVDPTSEQISREADLYYHDFYYERFVDHTPLWKKLKRYLKKMILRR